MLALTGLCVSQNELISAPSVLAHLSNQQVALMEYSTDVQYEFEPVQ